MSVCLFYPTQQPLKGKLVWALHMQVAGAEDARDTTGQMMESGTGRSSKRGGGKRMQAARGKVRTDMEWTPRH
jgi:hypothetical protein